MDTIFGPVPSRVEAIKALVAHDTKPYIHNETLGFEVQECGCSPFEYECELARYLLDCYPTLNEA